MRLEIVFDYNDEQIQITDKDEQRTVILNCSEPDASRPAIPHSGFKNVYPVVLLNYILHHSYRVLPSVLLFEQEEVYEYYERQELSKDIDKLLGKKDPESQNKDKPRDGIRTTLRWLNKYLENKNLGMLKIVGLGKYDESVIRISDDLNAYKVDWRIKTPNKRGNENIEKYCVSDTWISDNRTEEIANYYEDLRCEEIRNQYQSYDVKDLYESDFKSEEEIKIHRRIKAMALNDGAVNLKRDRISGSDRYTVECVSDAVYWKDRAIQYDGTVPAVFYNRYLDKSMLPKVAIADTGEEFIHLSDYVCNHMFGSNCHLALLQGKSGSGKSFSLHSAAYDLSHKRDTQVRQNYAIVINVQQLKEISLLEYIREYYMNSPVYDLFTEGVVGELFEKEDKNVIIMIDGLDRISIDRLHDISNKIVEIGQWQQQNVYFILAASNVNTIIQFGGLINNGFCFENYEKVVLKDISIDLLGEDEKELKDLLDANRELRTPLFISYYRGLTNIAYRMKIEAYVGNVDEMEFQRIQTYYDLFNARVDLLMKHAEIEGSDTVCYKYLLPMLAYYLLSEGDLDSIDIGIIDLLFPPVWKKGRFEVGITEELKWGINQLWEKDADFSRLSPVYKLLLLLNTGIIVPELSRESFDSSQPQGIRFQTDEFIFDSYEFREYLAARYAALIIKECQTAEIAEETIQRVLKCTSYTFEDDFSRIEKMRFVSFGYYLFLELTKDKDKLERHDSERISNVEAFTLLLAGNIAYERRLVWEGSIPLIRRCLDEMATRLNSEETFSATDWKMLDAINVISYENNGLIDNYADDMKQRVLVDTIWNINCCIVIIMNDIYRTYGKRDAFKDIVLGFEDNGLGSDECSIQLAQSLVATIEEQGVDALALNGYPCDYIAALLSNLGASHLQATKYFSSIGKLEQRDAHLDLAETLHHLAYSMRTAIVEHTDQRSVKEKTSVIRSLITLATDAYLRANYANSYKEIEKYIYLSESYYLKALNRQGITDLINDKLSLSTDPDSLIHASSVVERVRPDAEAFVILPRMCGGFYLLYMKAKESIEFDGHLGEEVKKGISELIDKQFIYLLASYLYLNKACLKTESESEYDSMKLDVQSKYVDQLWKDVEDKYIHSFFEMNNRKEEGFALLNKICDLYKALHPNTKVSTIELTPDKSHYKIKRSA